MEIEIKGKLEQQLVAAAQEVEMDPVDLARWALYLYLAFTRTVHASLQESSAASSAAPAPRVAAAQARVEPVLGRPLFDRGGLDGRLDECRRHWLAWALKQSGGVKKEAARLLGMSPRSFRYYAGKLGVES